MPRSPLAPATREDEAADLAVRRGRNAGGAWIVGATAAFGIGLLTQSSSGFLLAWLTGLVLLAIGLTVRARYWRATRRRLGDATVQRALWRSADHGQVRSERIVAAIAIVVFLLAFELWRR